MTISFDPQSVNRDLNSLCPYFADRVRTAIANAARGGLKLMVFEAWRPPNRQAWLYEQGRSSAGQIVTHSRPWESWHQYGLAIDFVYVDTNGNPSWKGDFVKAATYFTDLGLQHPLPTTDAGHIEITNGLNLAIAKGLYMNAGLQRVWYEAIAKLPGLGISLVS